MKIPKIIHGRHKIRDAAICKAWAIDLLTFEKVAEKFKLTERRIRQILVTNHAFIPIDKDWEQKKRVQNLKRWMKAAKDPETNKLELQKELRTEMEGSGPIISVKNEKYITVYLPGKADKRKSVGAVPAARAIPQE